MVWKRNVKIDLLETEWDVIDWIDEKLSGPVDGCLSTVMNIHIP
jgi:hypothetical protein